MDNLIIGNAYKGKTALYVLLQFLHSAFALLPPYCYLLFLNQIIMEQKFETLIPICLLYLLVYLGNTLLSVLSKRMYNRIFPAMHLELKEKVLEKYNSLDIAAVNGFTPGELKERLHKDTENVVLYGEKMLRIGTLLVRIAVTAGILLYLNRILALVSFALLPLSYYITRCIRGRSNVKYERKRQLQGHYNDFMIHNMGYWRETKANCLAQIQQQEFESLWQDMGSAFLGAHMCWFMNRTFLAFKDVFLNKMGLYLLGGFLALRTCLTLPVLLTFMEYYTEFVSRLLEAVDIIMKRGEQKESLKKVKEILQIQQPERPWGMEAMKTFEKLEFADIDFTYENEDVSVLKDFSLDVNRGDSLAITGESGCGKSTLLRLMAGYLVPAGGEIRWNGHPMHLVDRQAIYAKAGFLMQESVLFNLTIRENLLFGRQDATEAQMKDACARANIMDFIRELPAGLDTLIGENGIRLSGGQKQRLMIARLLLQNPEVIVFDEATSALDYQNESEILDLLLETAGEKTILMVTHRGTSMTKCGRIIRMEPCFSGFHS